MDQVTLTDLTEHGWKDYAMSVLAERAIPQIADGLKPVQRFLVYLGFKDGAKFKKVAAYAGNLAEAGYEHGETSGQDAMTKMTAEAQNILSLFDGDGNFGNKLDLNCAAARYIFAKQAKIMDLLYKDNDLCPENPDPEQKPPLYYLPIIPMVLVNGAKGIAVGWSCDIPSHDPVSIIDALIALCNGKQIGEIEPAYPLFTGEIKKHPDHYEIFGKWNLQSQTKLHITEIPPQYDQESYQAILDKLVDKGYIVDYEDNSKKDAYDIMVTLKRAKKYTEEDFWDKFKLRTTHKWNIQTISPDGKLQEWDTPYVFKAIITYFYNFRLPFILKRIGIKTNKLKLELAYKESYIRFANDVINQKFNWKIDETTFENALISRYQMPEEYIGKTMNSPVRSFTKENVAKATKAIDELKKELDYYLKTTPEKEYEKDLVVLKKALVKK